MIELPVNRPVVFEVTSKDVLHGFAIRALGVRVDANPGEVTTTPVVTPTRSGAYSVACVELCGLYHSYMWESVECGEYFDVQFLDNQSRRTPMTEVKTRQV